MKENYETLRNYLIENIDFEGMPNYEDAVRTVREDFQHAYSMQKVWRAAPVDVVKLSAQVLTSQDIYKLRREDFYLTLVEDALDILFHENVIFAHQLRAKWKRENKIAEYCA